MTIVFVFIELDDLSVVHVQFAHQRALKEWGMWCNEINPSVVWYFLALGISNIAV